jgi:hypothetical protein
VDVGDGRIWDEGYLVGGYFGMGYSIQELIKNGFPPLGPS